MYMVVFWFRRDLRFNDNVGLYNALSSGKSVLPIFIFDTEILNHLEDPDDARVTFIHTELENLNRQLLAIGSSLITAYGKPIDFFSELINRYPEISAVYTNRDYEPYGQQRDEQIKAFLATKQIGFYSFKDIVIYERNEVVKPDHTPYTVFTPYFKQWYAKLLAEGITQYNSEGLMGNFAKTEHHQIISLNQMGFTPNPLATGNRHPDLDLIMGYDKTRDLLAATGTTHVSVHLRFGTISIRYLAKLGLEHNLTYLRELAWRDFYHMILWHFPHVVNHSFKKQFDQIKWENNLEWFEKWKMGQTGYPAVDAGMRQLLHTGWMHNRARMITASFLVKNLLIDWRLGEAWFARKLLDFELASNSGGWQWTAGVGCDAAPYFRVFNPNLQLAKFDPKMEYVRQWAPEYLLGNPPQPIVELDASRNKALAAYRQIEPTLETPKP